MLNINSACTFGGVAAAEPGHGRQSHLAVFPWSSERPFSPFTAKPPGARPNPSLGMCARRALQGFFAFFSCLVDVRGCFSLKTRQVLEITSILSGLADLQKHRVPLTLLVPALAQPPVLCALFPGWKKDGDRFPRGASWDRTRKKVKKRGQGEFFCDESGETLT